MYDILDLLIPATLETVMMVFFSTVIAVVVGLPVGILMVCTRPGGIAENRNFYRVLDGVINVLRSVPFIILMIVVLPLAKILVGTEIGTKAVIVALSIAAAPFVARIMESSFLEVDRGVIEAAKAMGSSNAQIVWKVLLPETMPSIIDSITMTVINVIGYSAMAGTLGGGGLGNLAVRYGYYRYETKILFVAVVVIVVLVQIVQWAGTKLSMAINKK